MPTVIALYPNATKANNAAQDLVESGVPRELISVMTRDEAGQYADDVHDLSEAHVARQKREESSERGDATKTGAAVGGLAGAALGLASVVVPGLGPILAAGPLVSALAGAGIGAATGGLVGALADLGVPEKEAELYAEGLREGDVLVVVQPPVGQSDQVAEILYANAPIDLAERRFESSAPGKGHPSPVARSTVDEPQQYDEDIEEAGSATEEPVATQRENSVRRHVNIYGRERND